MKKTLIAMLSALLVFVFPFSTWAAPTGQGASCTGNAILSESGSATSQIGSIDVKALFEGLKSSRCLSGTGREDQSSASAAVNPAETQASDTSETASQPTQQTTCSSNGCSVGSKCAQSDCGKGDACTAANCAKDGACSQSNCVKGSTCAQSNCTAAAKCAISKCTDIGACKTAAGCNLSEECAKTAYDCLSNLLKKYGIQAGSCVGNLNGSSCPSNGQPTKPTPQPSDNGTGSSNSGNGGTTAPSTGSGSTTAPSTGKIDNLSFEKQVVALVNEQRVANGLSPLTLNEKLSNAARAKSQDMHDKKYFSHTSPTYGSPFDMLKTFGISYRAAGENIAMGYKTPQAVVDGWMNSPGHRANILNASFTQIGVGYVADGSYWTQEFIG